MGAIFETPESYRDLQIVHVRDLPGFHNPFKCDRRELFEAPLEAATVAAGRRRRLPWRRPPLQDLSVAEAAAIMAKVRGKLCASEVAACRYHYVDWMVIAAIACDLLDRRGEDLTEDEVWAAGASLSQRARECLRSLFAEPIMWYPSAPALTNGQHRACGLWFANAERVSVAPRAMADDHRV